MCYHHILFAKVVLCCNIYNSLTWQATRKAEAHRELVAHYRPKHTMVLSNNRPLQIIHKPLHACVVISLKRKKIGTKLQLMTNGTSYVFYRMAP